MRSAACLLISALAAAVPLAAASPTPGAVFKRSCSDCDSTSFCEFGYPGTPEGSVACVAESISRSTGLYRRYAAAWEECGTNDAICAGTSFLNAGAKASYAACQDTCDGNAQCVAFVWWGGGSNDCVLYSSVASHAPVGSGVRSGSKAGCGFTQGACI